MPSALVLFVCAFACTTLDAQPKKLGEFTEATTEKGEPIKYPWTCPKDVSQIVVLGVGGGGGGGCASPNVNTNGGGGGSGGGWDYILLDVKPGATYTIVVGNGGAGSSTKADGVNGGDTSVSLGEKPIAVWRGGIGGHSGGVYSDGKGGQSVSNGGSGGDGAKSPSAGRGEDRNSLMLFSVIRIGGKAGDVSGRAGGSGGASYGDGGDGGFPSGPGGNAKPNSGGGGGGAGNNTNQPQKPGGNGGTGQLVIYRL